MDVQKIIFSYNTIMLKKIRLTIDRSFDAGNRENFILNEILLVISVFLLFIAGLYLLQDLRLIIISDELIHILYISELVFGILFLVEFLLRTWYVYIPDKNFIGVDESVQGVAKSVETAFQTLDKEDFHEPSHVFLGLLCQLIHCPGVVEHGHVSGIREFPGNQLNRFVENFVFFLAELVIKRLRCSNLWES